MSWLDGRSNPGADLERSTSAARSGALLPDFTDLVKSSGLYKKFCRRAKQEWLLIIPTKALLISILSHVSIPDSKLLHDSSEEDEEFFFRHRLPKTGSLPNSESNYPLVIDEPSLGINETVWIEVFWILEMLRVM